MKGSIGTKLVNIPIPSYVRYDDFRDFTCDMRGRATPVVRNFFCKNVILKIIAKFNGELCWSFFLVKLQA